MSLFKNFFSSSDAKPASAAADIPGPEVHLEAHLTKIAEKFPGEFGDRDHFYVHSSVRCGGDDSSRVPSNIVLVIDVSGSMNDSVTAGNNEQTGLNILHIVKHAVNTIKEVCGENDRLAIVKFNDRAQLVMNMKNMDKSGKQLVDETLSRLNPGGSTNIWGAVHLAFETLHRDPSATARNSFVLLLTDGVPNVQPPNGLTHVNALKEYRTQIGSLPGTLCTFGFGYNLDSILLRDLANFAGGMYSFIPDAGMVGTAFINSISNIMCSVIRDATVNFELAPEVQIVSDPQLSEDGHTITPDNCKIDRASIQAGQSCDVIKRISVPKNKSSEAPLVNVSLNYLCVGQQNRIKKSTPTLQLTKSQEAYNYEVMANVWRLRSVALLKESHAALIRSHPGTGPNPTVENISAFVKELQDYIDEHRTELTQHRTLERLQDLGEDIEGQVLEACTKHEFWFKWGRHYLPSLTSAHDLQQSNNFKDPGIQHYGGVLFNTIRDFADEAFSRLPPPQGNPTRVAHSTGAYASGGAGAASPVMNMAAFNNRNSGCVHADCLIPMSDGKLKMAKYVVRGDKLNNGSVVSGVMKTICYNNEAALCKIEELLVTPYHPIKHNGVWTFPNDIAKPQMVPCDAVYSFLLVESNGKFCQSLNVSGLECIALGHGIENDPVASHPFFGTSEVVNSLKSAKDWSRADGVVTLSQTNKEGTMIRDKETGLICGLIPMDMSVPAN